MPGRRRVLCLAGLKRGDRRLLDVLGRVEVRLARREAADVLAGGLSALALASTARVGDGATFRAQVDSAGRVGGHRCRGSIKRKRWAPNAEGTTDLSPDAAGLGLAGFRLSSPGGPRARTGAVLPRSRSSSLRSAAASRAGSSPGAPTPGGAGRGPACSPQSQTCRWRGERPRSPS